jgi:radical SAM superfamily enzyme YgiQ (UPF0313 family)
LFTDFKKIIVENIIQVFDHSLVLNSNSPHGGLNEIRENFEKYSVKKYTIVDDTFNESTEKLNAIYESLKANDLQIEFSCYIRLDLVARNPEQIVLLKKMGCTSVFLGIETLNERAAKAIGKGAMVELVKDTLKKMFMTGFLY